MNIPTTVLMQYNQLSKDLPRYDSISYKTNIFSEQNPLLTIVDRNEEQISSQDENTITTNDTDSTTIPISILKGHSSLEAMVVFLKDIKGITFSNMSKILHRDQRTLWNSYNDAKKKNITYQHHKIEENVLYLPLNIFSGREMSILESIVFYLTSTKGLSFNEIASILGKNYRTIWTVQKRALRKIGKC